MLGSRTVAKVVLAVPAALVLAACGTSAMTPAHTAALTVAAQPLSCQASVSNAAPSDFTKTAVRVRTDASAKVFTVAYYRTVNRAYFARADFDGRAQVSYYVSGATPGYRVRVAVTVVRGRTASTCQTSFTPKKPGSPAPSPSPSPSPSSSSPTPNPSSPAACHPTTSSGHCYKPGEFCPAADHGMDGVDGKGEAIVCEDNNGWRWELA
jgi:hypothetical protein